MTTLPPITRREWMVMDAVLKGVPVMIVREAVASVGMSHEPGWLDVLVDQETGQEIGEAA